MLPSSPIKVFISYAPEDEPFLHALEKHLALMQREGLIETWHARKVGAGEDWRGVMDAKLEAAGLVLLLVSADFMASDYCHDVEVKRALERHEKGEACAVPVLLRPCDWESAPFGKLNTLPERGTSISKAENQDEALTEVVKVIRSIVERPSSAQFTIQPVRPHINRFSLVLAITSAYGYLLAAEYPVWLDRQLTTHKAYGARNYPGGWLIPPLSLLVFVGTWLLGRRQANARSWWLPLLPLSLAAVATVPILVPEVPHPWLVSVALEWLTITALWLLARSSSRLHDGTPEKFGARHYDFVGHLFRASFFVPILLAFPALLYMKNASHEMVTDATEFGVLNGATVVLVGSLIIFWYAGPTYTLYRAWQNVDGRH